VANLATLPLRDAMNATSAPLPRGENEFIHAGLTMAECRLVAAPRVAESPASMECKVVEVVEIRGRSGTPSGHVLILGEVVGFHIDEAFVRDGRFDTAGARPIARCGYQDYAVVGSLFSLARPTGGGDV
jgi:flavin reductase (DIM6/NTAB) family NADH-FMN oxidoreductase RutF